MKLIDEEGKLFGIVNVIDVCIIIIVIVLGVGAFYKFNVLDKTSSTAAMQPITYTVRVDKIRDFVLSNVETGDTIFDQASGNAIGTIVNVESEQAYEYINMPDGTFTKAPVENRINVIFTIEADAVVNDSGCYVNRTFELLRGSQTKYMTKYFECTGIVESINVG